MRLAMATTSLWLAGLWMAAAAQTGLPSGCYQSNYTSTFTRCDLTFLFCFNYVQLKSCVLRKCDRFVRAGDCLSETAFEQSEADCYRNCCGADSFDQKQCDEYNHRAEQQKSQANTNLTIALIIIAVFLLTVVIIFAVRRLKCCEKGEPFVLIRFNVKWRKAVYEDTKCGVCHTYGAMLTTSCKHSFHVSCFEEAAEKMQCPSCAEPLRDRIRIFCFLCRQKAFKVKIVRIGDIADALLEGRALHIDECPREPKTHQPTLKT